MWAYAQYNPNKGQGDLIKSNSPTSAHQLAPALLRHAKDHTVTRQASQLIPWSPPPTIRERGGGVLLPFFHPYPQQRIQLSKQLNHVMTPTDNGRSPKQCANMSP